MSVAAVMLVKDEADVIEATVKHLLAHVDEVYVLDNGSTDGTYEALEALPVDLTHDPDPAYAQGQKTTGLALRALSGGHTWVVPCDADEVWYVAGGGRIRDWLAEVPAEVDVVNALMYEHVVTPFDDTAWEAEIVFERMRFRRRDPELLGKVAARLRSDVVIAMGNHSAYYVDAPGGDTLERGLALRHFPARSAEQYLRKVRVGSAACAVAQLDPIYCSHWRQFDGEPDDAVLDYYRRHHRVAEYRHPSIVYDPAPVIS